MRTVVASAVIVLVELFTSEGDRFSSASLTARQQSYANPFKLESVYTPVVRHLATIGEATPSTAQAPR